MERTWHEYIPEGSAPDRLKKTLSLAMRRQQYDRVPLEGEGLSNGEGSLRRSRTTVGSPDPEATIALGSGFHKDDTPPTPSVWGKVRDAYVNMMVKTADDSSTTTVVAAPKELSRSLTLGTGFGKKVEVPEASLPFKLSKSEQKYLEHLRRMYDGRYA